jgi:hypothetical protein
MDNHRFGRRALLGSQWPGLPSRQSEAQTLTPTERQAYAFTQPTPVVIHGMDKIDISSGRSMWYQSKRAAVLNSRYFAGHGGGASFAASAAICACVSGLKRLNGEESATAGLKRKISMSGFPPETPPA